jgi:hypothetical protein
MEVEKMSFKITGAYASPATVMVGSGPQLATFAGHWRRAECGKLVCLLSDGADVSASFKPLRIVGGDAEAVRVLPRLAYVQVGCRIVSHWYPFYGGSRSTAPEFTTTAAWIAASKGEK